MSKKITDIEGIGPAFAEKLSQAQIRSVEKLLEKGSTRSGRKSIAELSGVDEGKVLDWVNMADLFRVKGVASQFAELLKASGVDTVKELKMRNPENLHNKMIEVNNSKHLTRVVPGVAQLGYFINQAKTLDPRVTY